MISDFKDYIEKHRLIHEAFEREVSRGLQTLFDYVRREVGNPTDSFERTLNLRECGFADMRVHLTVNFEPSPNIRYHSNVNIYNVIFGRDNLEIPIQVRDTVMNVPKLNGVIAHELKHVYDVLTVNEEHDMDSFVRAMHLDRVRDPEYRDFSDRVYLSFEHELVARNTMMYQEYDQRELSRDELKSLFEESYVHEALVYIGSFNHLEFLKGKDPVPLMEYTNRFVEYFGGTPVTQVEELTPFYSGWEEFFRNMANEFTKEAYHTLDRIHSGNGNLGVTERLSSYNERAHWKVRDMIRNAYKIYVLPVLETPCSCGEQR